MFCGCGPLLLAGGGPKPPGPNGALLCPIGLFDESREPIMPLLPIVFNGPVCGAFAFGL
jgi:hypothetical protein